MEARMTCRPDSWENVNRGVALDSLVASHASIM